MSTFDDRQKASTMNDMIRRFQEAPGDENKAKVVLRIEGISTCFNDWFICFQCWNILKDPAGRLRCLKKMEETAISTQAWLRCIAHWSKLNDIPAVDRCRTAYYHAELKRTLPSAPENVIKEIVRITAKKNPGSTPLHDFIRHQLIAYVRHNYTDYDDSLKHGEDRESLRKKLHPEIIDGLLLKWARRKSVENVSGKDVGPIN
jgi:hypothetical protein